MQHEVKKITHLVNEIVTLMMKKEQTQIDVSIKRDVDQAVIQVVQHHCPLSDEEVEHLRNKLNGNRQHEVEGYYWQLVGENDCDDELCLVGAMTDESEVTLEEGKLIIRLVRRYD